MPVPLPPELASFLRDHQFALITHSSNVGAVLIAKMPAADIDSCRGALPIHVRFECHTTPYGPIARLLITVYDQPQGPLYLETFFNPSDAQQMDDLTDLVSRPYLRILFYDEAGEHRLSKRVAQSSSQELRSFPTQTRLWLAHTDPRDIDFDAAKLIIMGENPL